MSKTLDTADFAVEALSALDGGDTFETAHGFDAALRLAKGHYAEACVYEVHIIAMKN